ncbi:acyltransferase [Adhaeretor mobilis]|uniref:UDP-2-acetamido-3-amino-2, 3-dideoxy-D-glucuronate N-acetyltransferase n=1 Tax=Adhaeretor mobilis TaxID=1930276 RepID=A0A517MY52_9BACT|nr:acyltransferase [Adhaeretor mobilis]QDS99808.1 UDP-2-acetamido-3-amino-2,3-dideoxy-D-glucuronate N-acetyltransferase [Adhaeretor mobilis]
MSQDETVRIHESSYVDDGVEIGEGTAIWHFCHLLTGTRLGQRCKVGQNVTLGPRVTVGTNVKIQNNVSVYEGVTLEDDVFVGPSVVFTNVFTPRSAFPRNTSDAFLPTLVQQGASIGANATIVCGSTVGRHALIGAGSVVTRDVPDHAIVYGNPARLKGWACECGVPLDFQSEAATCGDCLREYMKEDQVVKRAETNALLRRTA